MLTRGLLMQAFSAMWAYRGFILGSVKREFQSKYQDSLLGASWLIINPLAMILVYTLIFSQVMSTRLPGVDSSYAYSIYLCAGLLTWGLFAEIVARAQNVFLEHATLLKKLNFPRLCLPAVVVLNALMNFSIIFSLFIAFLIILDAFPGWPLLALVPLLLVHIAFAIGLGISLGILNVFFRDVGQLFSVILQFWFWFTPIVYPATILPEFVRPYIVINPLAGLSSAYQTILVNGQWPKWEELWLVGLLAPLLCLNALRLFRHHSGEMVDEL